MNSTVRTQGGNMNQVLFSTIFWPGHGFLGRFGPKLADWEPVLGPEDCGLDVYEINMRRRQLRLK